MTKLYHDTLIPGDPFGLDSIQGFLEMAIWLDGSGMRYSVQEGDEMLVTLSQLQDEGLLHFDLIEDETEFRELRSVRLTTAGHKLLDELRKKSVGGRFKERLSNLVWTMFVSILTTLATLQIAN